MHTTRQLWPLGLQMRHMRKNSSSAVSRILLHEFNGLQVETSLLLIVIVFVDKMKNRSVRVFTNLWACSLKDNS